MNDIGHPGSETDGLVRDWYATWVPVAAYAFVHAE
jgi:hypothetical protein